MAANGGGPPFVKKEEDDVEEEFDSNNKPLVGKNNNKGISIAERRAAKCGFNASSINATRFRTAGLTPLAQSPYFTVPPGLSPSALLDSPVMLPNAQAQLSPTTGTFQFPAASPPNHENLKPKLKLASNGDNAIAMESSSGAEALGVPLSESCPSNFRAETKAFEEFKYPREMVNKDCFEETGEGKNEVKCLKLQPSRNQQILLMVSENDESGKGIGAQDKQQHQKSAASIPKEVTKCCEDGFYWRKYGQKHVKGSEYPRSYYKCTNTNCPVTKKVERSHDGQISEIVYKGSHNHPKPQQPLKRFNEMAGEGGGVSCLKVGGASDAVFTSSDCNGLSSFIVSDPLLRSRSATATARAIEIGQDQLNAASPESISNEDEGENGVCEPRKRKRDGDGESTRSAREPKVVVQIESDIDILDDGYRWRKYGQKVVKGNPNPRSYYKCTTPGCPVRKHVERAADDIKSVVTTYEGKHSHEVPSSRSTSSLMVPDVANSTASQKPDALKSGKQMPLYQLERNPVLNNNYNEFMRSNLPGDHLNFGASSAYPLSLPPFHSLPYLMNSNPMSSKLYPMIPDYMSMPSQMINPPLPGSSNAPLAGNFHYNNNSYAGVAEASSTGGQDRGEEYSSHTKMVKPKEEQTDDQDELYDNDYCLSTPNHGNGAL